MPHSTHDTMPLGRSIGRTAKFVRAWGDRALSDFDSDVTEWIVLRNIAVAPAPGASQAEIARFSDMGGPALVRHIDRLESDGLVTRTRDATDRRTIRLRLTPAGQTHFDEIRTVIERCDSELRAQLGKQQAETMQRALDTLFEFCLTQLAGKQEPQTPPTSRARSKR